MSKKVSLHNDMMTQISVLIKNSIERITEIQRIHFYTLRIARQVQLFIHCLLAVSSTTVSVLESSNLFIYYN